MSLQQTSLTAFRLLDAKKLSQRQQQVFDAIEELQPCSDKQIAAHTGIAYHTVAARRGELGHTVELAGVGKQDGRAVRLYRVHIPDFPSLREMRAGLREAE